MDVVALATRRRLTRNPEMEEACEMHAAFTVMLCWMEQGTPEHRAASASRSWWFNKIRRLNPGGAQIVRFPVPSEAKKRGMAAS